MDATALRQLHQLKDLRDALAQRGVWTALDRHPVPFLVIPVLHLSGRTVMAHVVIGHAGPDQFVWGFGDRRHDANDPGGAADRLTTYAYRPATDDRAHG